MSSGGAIPFAGYRDLAHCVSQNEDKSDPAAYCATIQRAVEKADAEDSRFRIAKIDDENHLVFGWASVAVRKDGQRVLDSQGDLIEPEELEYAAYSFVLHSGDANEMHDREPVGRPVESLVVTPEKLEKMGLPGNALPQGWWLGFYIDNEQAWAKVKSGELRAMSIEGIAERVPV